MNVAEIPQIHTLTHIHTHGYTHLKSVCTSRTTTTYTLTQERNSGRADSTALTQPAYLLPLGRRVHSGARHKTTKPRPKWGVRVPLCLRCNLSRGARVRMRLTLGRQLQINRTHTHDTTNKRADRRYCKRRTLMLLYCFGK